jgi:SET domain-containing protein
MKPFLVQKSLKIKKSSIHGYGVFAGENIQEGEIIEECYALLTQQRDTALKDYYFRGGNQGNAVLLGYGWIYNHANKPSASYIFDEENKVMTFKAVKSIAAGEEIFISYGTNWFSSRNAEVKHASLWYKTKRILGGVFLRGFVIIGLIYLLVKMFNGSFCL